MTFNKGYSTNTYKINYSKLPAFNIKLIILALPFIQLGVSYYFSFFFILFVFSFLLSLTSNINKKEFHLLLIGCSVFLIKSVILSFYSSSIREILFPLREMTCFIGIVAITNFLSKAYIDKNFLFKVLGLFLILLLLLIRVQKEYLSNGEYLGFPIDYYVINKETLDNVFNALYHRTRFRPTSFYGEPSYTAWITLSLLTILIVRKEFNKEIKYFAIIIGLLIVSISESFSGILLILIFSFFWIYFQSKRNNLFLTLSIAVFFLTVFLGILYFFSSEFYDRIQNIFQSNDISYSIRILTPFKRTQSMLLEGNFFGVRNYSSLVIDNALIGLFIQYGLFSLIIIGILWHFVKNKLLFVYILLSLNFNGTFFRYDKVLVVSMVIGLCFCRFFDLKKK